MVPYNTGKVKIGSKYKPPVRPPIMDKDALRLQRALLGDRKRLSDKSVAAIGVVVAIGISAIMMT